jgi:hypothetical protein
MKRERTRDAVELPAFLQVVEHHCHNPLRRRPRAGSTLRRGCHQPFIGKIVVGPRVALNERRLSWLHGDWCVVGPTEWIARSRSSTTRAQS